MTKQTQPEPKKYTQQNFIEMYQQLCKLTGWQLAAAPSFRPMNDLGGSLITAIMGVAPFVPANKETKK